MSNLQTSFCSQLISIDPNEEGLWIIPPFESVPGLPGTEAGAAIPPKKDKEPPGGGKGDLKGRPGEEETQKEGKKVIGSVSITGSVPVENWAELFRCFVGPAARMQLKKLGLRIEFKLEPRPENPFSADDPALKAMREAAKQLGLKFETSE